MSRKHKKYFYTMQVGTDTIRIHANDSYEATKRAIEIWHDKRHLFMRSKPSCHVISRQ